MTRIYFLLLLFLVPFPLYAEEVLEIEEIEVEGDNYNRTFIKNDTTTTIIQTKVQEQSRLSVRQYTPSDVILEYHGVILNDSADNKVELYHYPKYILRNISQSDRVSFGPSYSLQEDEIDGSLLANIQLTTLNDYELYTQFKTDYISGLFFGNFSEGDFEFINSKEEIQIRENNKQERLGFSVYDTILFNNTIIQPFFYYSRFKRGVGGLSEFPQQYKDSEESGNLVLINTTISTLIGLSEIESSFSYRYQTYTYDNPHSKYHRDSYISNDDNSLSLKMGYKYPIDLILLGGNFEYSYNLYNDKERNTITINPIFQIQYDSFSASVQTPLLIQPDFYFQYRLGLEYRFYQFTASINSSRAIRLPTFNELYFRNEFIHGDKKLSTQVSYNTYLRLSYSYEYLTPSLTLSYSYLQDLIRFTQDTPYLFVAHNIPTVQVFTVSPAIQSHIWKFIVKAEYNYNYSKVEDLEELPMLSKHEFYLSSSIEGDSYKVILIYSYLSPKYLHFTNTTETLSDSNLSIKISYRYDIVEALLEFNNILNSRRESAIQNPLPRFNASFNLKISL